VDLAGFDAAVQADPVGYLNLSPLEAFRAEGGALRPGELLSVYRLYCVEAEGQRSFRAIAALDRLGFLASLRATSRCPG
jgi:hypothetical protein